MTQVTHLLSIWYRDGTVDPKMVLYKARESGNPPKGIWESSQNHRKIHGLELQEFAKQGKKIPFL